jgi:hypothetical protein
MPPGVELRKCEEGALALALHGPGRRHPGPIR